MKVLQINTFCGKESTGKIVEGLYRLLKDKGNECCVAYGRENTIKNVKTIKIGTLKDIYLHAILTRMTDRQSFYSEKATCRFVKDIKEYNPDVVHLHNLHGYYLNLPVLFRYLAEFDIKVIWTLHDCWPFTGHCAYFDLLECNKWKIHCYDCKQKKSYPKSLWMDASKRNYEEKKKLFTSINNLILVTPSKWMKDLVSQSFLKTYPIEIIPNGIDLTVFKPTYGNFREKYGLQNKYVILGVASVWSERKGLNDFIKLNKIIDHKKQKIVLVGINEAMRKKVPPEIICINKIENQTELAKIYTTADLFFNPTYEDNYPTTNLEAIACETPVITYNTGGARETIVKGTGYVLEKGKYMDILEISQNRKWNKLIDKSILDRNMRFSSYIKLYQN